MGALHEGHLTLARRARAECAVVVLSVFVNPAQFNDPADLAAYPRDEQSDVDLASSAGLDVVFAPPVEEVYPPGFTATVALHGPLVEGLEGAYRGVEHFSGVTTVVAKFFGMAQPDLAYFGQKDAQQARVVRAMVADLDIPTGIVVVPTVRESDGLAMSSRNRHLSPADRARAAYLFAALRFAQERAESGVRDVEAIRAPAWTMLADAGIDVEYLELVDADTFHPVHVLGVRPAVLAVAATIGNTRLIDNLVLHVP
jgi:pantoate--beta-alanine ligase